MTNREFYTAVINANVNAELNEFAQTAIEKLDAANAKKAEKLAEKRAEEQPIYDALAACLTEEPQTASDLAAQVPEISSVQKASSMLRKLVDLGVAVSTDLKVKGRTAKGYAKA